MRYLLFDVEASTYSTAVLVKHTSFNKTALQQHYITPLQQMGIPASQTIGFTLKYNDSGKCPAGFAKDYLQQLMPTLQALQVQVLYVCDSAYFKILTKQTKADPHMGYAVPCTWPGCETMQVVLGINYQALFYKPELQQKLETGLQVVRDWLLGQYVAPGTGILRTVSYPQTVAEIQAALNQLHQYPMLSCDTETFSLKFCTAGLGTIAFAWDQHSAVAFTVDVDRDPLVAACIRQLLREFFEQYKGKLLWYNSTFDITILVYALWMTGLQDVERMLLGIHHLCRNAEDVMLMTYLATNSCAGNELSLKVQAQEFAGNWAQSEINDITQIPTPDLLRYNAVDTISTWFVYHKHWPTVQTDQQEEVYRNIFMASVPVIVQMQLTGLPVNPEQVQKVKKTLTQIQQQQQQILADSPIIQQYNLYLQQDAMVKKNATLKVKQHPLSAFSHVIFNPGSDKQVSTLLFDSLGLPVLDLTDSKQPSVGSKTLKKLRNHTTDPGILELLNALVALAEVDILLSTFITAFEQAVEKGDGKAYLYGSFKLGGTVSGRLSSAAPNLQNIPSGSKYAKLIKSCIQPPSGWLLVGADFASLEDRISALTTKDPNKIKVYTDGYDGHCLRAYSYFGNQMMGIDPTNVDSINSIEKLYKDLRQRSKGPTFLLTYGGSSIGLHKNLGFPIDEAKAIEANYHELYKVSDQWVQDKLTQASKDGYVTVAFGMRVRTPLLQQALLHNRHTPYEAQAEGRTAGNALGQSYCMLNNRAAIEFRQRVLTSPYRLDILPVAHIHDAQYFLIRDDIAVVEWVNDNLVACMQWQDDPAIYHPEVKLGGELAIYHPDWATEYKLPNNATQTQIRMACQPKEKK